MSKYKVGDDCMWDHCSSIATCPCCEKDMKIAELEADNERLIEIVREAYETDHNSSFADWLDLNGYKFAKLQEKDDE